MASASPATGLSVDVRAELDDAVRSVATSGSGDDGTMCVGRWRTGSCVADGAALVVGVSVE